jgi:CHAT domain-containing protein
VQSTLPEGTTLVEYFTIGDEVLVFIISRNEARIVRRLCSASHVISQQERLGFQLEKFMLGNEYVSAHSKQILESTNRHLHELQRNLTAPFINEIRTARLTIVPHGSLHFLPFHAFYDGEKYLIDDYEISYAPSASVQVLPEKKNRARFLLSWSRLTSTVGQEEVARLSRLFPARVLVDESATREAFIKNCRAAAFVPINARDFPPG